MVEAEEIKTPASFLQVNDPGLRRLRLQTHFAQQNREGPEGPFGLLAGGAHHHQIIGEADQDSHPAGLPSPVQPVQVDIAEQGRDNPTLGSPGNCAPDHAVFHHPGAQNRPQELEDVTVTYPFLDRRDQPVVRDRLETGGDIRLCHPTPAPPGLVNEDLEGVVHRPLGSEAEADGQEVGLEHGLEDEFQCPLHDSVADRGDG